MLASRVFSIEPHRTSYDLFFRVTGIPCRVTPFFWIVTTVMAAELPTLHVMMWIAVVFVSILIHELGHAWAARSCGWPPHIVLYELGGLAIYSPDYVAPWRQIFISLAGPGAGFAFGLLVMAATLATGHSCFVLSWWVGWGPAFSNPNLNVIVGMLLHVNLIWGAVNLLPIYPLDGGRVAQVLWSMHDPLTGMRKTLTLSIVVASIAAAVAFFVVKIWYPAVFFTALAVMAYLNLRQLSAAGGYGGYGNGSGGYGGGGYDDGYEDRGGRGW